MTAATKPGENAVAVTPSDSTGIKSPGSQPIVTRGLWIGGSGDISVEMVGPQMDDQTVVFTGIASGTLLPLAITRVNATLTTATSLVAIW